MRLATIFCLLMFTASAFAQSGLPHMSVKERLRVLLWTEGLNETNIPKAPTKKPLIEEIERPLRKI